MTMRFLAFLILIGILACDGNNTGKDESTIKGKNKSKSATETESVFAGYTRIEATEIPDNLIQLISEDWTMVAVGNKDSYNAMTASWGTFGELWGKHVATLFIRDTRYTHEFIERESHFTMNFYSEEYRGALNIVGSRSGREGDKIKEAGLDPIETPSGNMSFKQARMIIECRKLYAEPLKKEGVIDTTLRNEWYDAGDNKSMHTMVVGEIVNVWVK